MRYEAMFGFDKEISRSGADIGRLVGGPSLGDELAHLPAFGMETAVRHAFIPIADGLLKSMFDPPLEGLRNQLSGLGLDTAIRDSFVDVGQSIFGMTAEIGRIQDLAVKIPDASALFSSIEIGNFISPLPDLGPFLDWYESGADEGAGALGEGGFGFSQHLFTRRFLAGMAWIAPRVRGAAVTNRLLSFVRQDAFKEELRGHYDRSSYLRRRWPIVNSALDAHLEGNYTLAIPTLLAQVEGSIGDAFVLKKSVISRGRKLYEKGSDGKPKLNKHGEPIAIPGARRLLQVGDLSTHPLLIEISDVLTNGLIDERNGILHGRDVKYPRTGLSLRTLLILLVVAPDIVAFEKGEIESDIGTS